MSSFEAVPLAGVMLKPTIGQKMIELTAMTFIVAIKISAPIILALFSVTVAMGILARTVPQMNVFIVGFPVQLAVGLFVLVASLPLFNVLLEKSYTIATDVIKSNMGKLTALAEYLLEHETIEGDKLKDLLNQSPSSV